MRAVILAAGEGTRLRPHTLDKPKCLVPLAGRPLLAWQVDALSRAGIRDITVVTGYRADRIALPGIATVHNRRFHDTNMVASLMCARALFDGSDDIVIAYGDLVYESRVISALVASAAPIAVTVDRQWRRLWETRMADPLADAETLRLDAVGNIIELGRKPASIDQIEAQYMGLIGVKAGFTSRFVDAYDSLDPAGPFDGRDRDHMFMTSFLQHLIDKVTPVAAVPCDGGWLEIDSCDDLDVFASLHANGQLGQLCTLEPAVPSATPARRDHQRIFERLSQQVNVRSEAAPISVAGLVKTWLDAGPMVFRGELRATLDALCRQIDIKKKVAAAYGENWKMLEPWQAADLAVTSGLAAVLLGNTSAGEDSELGWRLKCVNSALKLLDLYPDPVHRPALLAWAWEVLDRAGVDKGGR